MSAERVPPEFGDIDIKALGIDLDEDSVGSEPEEIEHTDD